MSLLKDDECRNCFHVHPGLPCTDIASDPGPDGEEIHSVCGCIEYVDLEAEGRIMVRTITSAKEFGEANRKWLVSGAVYKSTLDHLKRPIEPLSIGLHHGPLPKVSRRQRLKRRWRDLRYTVGHWIVGYECED